MKRTTVLLALGALLFAGSATADETKPIRVVATLPDVGSIAASIGGKHVTVTTLAKGYEDPHYVTPTPALMNAVSKADLFLEIGLSLEIWSERVVDGARNPRVRVGRPGHQLVSKGVRLLEIPQVVTRAEGDLHPEGNPHIWLDPLNGLVMARNVRDALVRVDPAHKKAYGKGYADFEAKLYRKLYGEELVKLFGGIPLARLDAAGRLVPFLEERKLEGKPLIDRLGGLHGKALAFRGKKIVFYHKSWIYFAERFGLEIAAYVEDKPGIAPSAKHRDALIARVKKEKIPVIARTNYFPAKMVDAIAKASGAKAVVLPNATKGVDEAGDYLAFLDVVVSRLSKAYGGK